MANVYLNSSWDSVIDLLGEFREIREIIESSSGTVNLSKPLGFVR
jgi:hypothetical protein